MELQHPFAVITPTVDGDVLGVLAAAHSTFTVAQSSRLIAHRSPAGIRQAMRRLVEQGIVLEHRIGRSATYELNDEHLAAVPIRALAAMKSSLLDRLRAAVADWPNPPVFGAMFGSAARGDMRAQSDLDILLVREAGMSDESWLSHVVRLSASATAWTGNDARIVDVTEDDIDDPSIRPLLDEVLADGIAFTDDSGWLTRVLRAQQADMRS